MAQRSQLRVTIPLNFFDVYCSFQPSPMTRRCSITSGEKSELQLQAKSIVERVTSNPITVSNIVIKETAQGYEDERLNQKDNTTISDYDDNEDRVVQTTEIATKSVTGPKFTRSQHRHGLCSPGSYAEFAVNPYSNADSSASGNTHNPQPDSTQEPKYAKFCLPLRSARRNRTANLSGHYQRSRRPEYENIGETLARLSNNLSCAYDAIRNEELATLRFLQELST
ncbi:hypothetical protein F4804DRAFT_320108 [Jackrogersella minutella]|nr:hypothetical protein F4804DRAFT_320108 [Jackrogersella minutella]